MTAVSSKRPVISIVQEDDIASARVPQALNHRGRGLRLPIPRPGGPHHDGRSSLPADRAGQLRPAKSERRAHPARPKARRSLDRLVAAEEFGIDAPRREQRQGRMSLRVVSNSMAPRGNLPGQLRKGAHVPPDEEKRRAGPMFIEQIEECGSHGWIWAVIEGKSDRRGVSCVAERRPEELG